MAVDLHTHSLVSDGTDTPTAIITAAAAADLTWVSLTDHDTLAGIPEAASAAAEIGIGFIPGIELSVGWETGEMHLLVYFLEPGPGPLQDRLEGFRDSRVARAHRTVALLNDLGYELSYSDVAAEAGGESIGRPHIADALVAIGRFPDRDAVFDELLHAGGPAYIRRDLLEATDAIELSRLSGGVPVLAHPYTIDPGPGGYEAALRTLVEAGLGGIEAHHSEHRPNLRDSLVTMAAALGVAATGGSDYHGAGKPGLNVGTGRGSLNVPDESVDQLRSQLD